MLRLVDLRKSYRILDRVLPILDGISFEVSSGEFCAILGPSGSGKSTLMNIMGLLDQSSSGAIYIDGISVEAASKTQAAHLRNSLIGFVFQSFQLLPRLTAAENVALPLLYRRIPRNERLAMANAMLERLDLGARTRHRPNELSGGQKQRVALARALVGAPKIILADEPTGSLDSATASETIALLRSVNETLGTTIVMVTHDQTLATRCDRRIELLDGKVVADSRIGPCQA